MTTPPSKITQDLVTQNEVSWSFEQNLYSGLGGESYPVSLSDAVEMSIATQQVSPRVRPQFDRVVNLVQKLFGDNSQTYLNTGEHYLSITVMKDFHHVGVIYFRVSMGSAVAELTHTFSNPFFPKNNRNYGWKSSDNFSYEEIIFALEKYVLFVKNHGANQYEREFFAAAYELSHQNSEAKSNENIIEYLDALTPLTVDSLLKFRALTSDVPVELLEALKDAPEEWIKTVLPKEMVS